jgi:hypothetical protein
MTLQRQRADTQNVYCDYKSLQVFRYLQAFVTEEIELSNYFLQDFKNLAATAKNIFKKVKGSLKK